MEIVVYNARYEEAWDRFINKESLNGTFLQTRRFLNYHPEGRFEDHSLLFMIGTNIAAVIPANVVHTQEGNILYSHQGSTFGGIVLGKCRNRIDDIDMIFRTLEEYLEEQKFTKIILKMTGSIYSLQRAEGLEYFLFLNGYEQACEIGYYIDFSNYGEEIEKNFTASRRRDYKYSLNHGLVFTKLALDQQIEEFYRLLLDNYKKFDARPVHELRELLEFKNSRLSDIVEFYGVYNGNLLVAGSMVFCFGKKVFHTQYIASDQEMLSLYVNEFLYKNLIETARLNGFNSISFGTSTLENGRVLNRSLAQFKAGFGTSEYVNRTFQKTFSQFT